MLNASRHLPWRGSPEKARCCQWFSALEKVFSTEPNFKVGEVKFPYCCFFERNGFKGKICPHIALYNHKNNRYRSDICWYIGYSPKGPQFFPLIVTP